MVVSNRRRHLSNKARCTSRDLSAYGCLRARLGIAEEDLARFCLSQISWIELEAIEGSIFSMEAT